MIAQLNRTSLLWGACGLAIQAGGIVVAEIGETQVNLPLMAAGLLVVVVGTAALVVGLCYYARSKGRHPAWGLWGLLSLLGLVVLSQLEDRTVRKIPLVCTTCGYDLRGSPAATQCPECGQQIA